MNHQNILFLSNLIPECMTEEVAQKQSRTMQNAAVSFQDNLISGIEINTGAALNLFNLLPINSYPRFYSDASVKSFAYAHTENARDYNVGFCNLQYIKHILLSHSYKKQFKKYWKQHHPAMVICYTPNINFLKALKWVKKKHPQVKSCVIIPDMPEFNDMSNNQSLIRRCFYRHTSKKTRKYIQFADSFVYLTEQSAAYFCDTKPYTVVEGIIPDSRISDHPVLTETHPDLKQIVYTGTTNQKFGILTLLEAFSMIEGSEYRLVICGCGDSDEIIREKSRLDPRIVFKGIVSHKEALQIQKTATVLVNPRQNIGEFTKYSFPSKTLEYLASGVPLVAYKLDGIPDEYNGYIHYVGDNRPETLAETLQDVCSRPDHTRKDYAQKARLFVETTKNKIYQTQRIVDMLMKL